MTFPIVLTHQEPLKEDNLSIRPIVVITLFPVHNLLDATQAQAGGYYSFFTKKILF